MIELNLECKTKEQELIKSYLEQNISEVLADKINNGVKIIKDNKELVSKKDLNGFFSYANDEARKLAEKGATSACVEDKTVYGWAVHYFEEDSIEGQLFNIDGSEFKPTIKTKDRTPTTSKNAVKKQAKDDSQPSLFDLMSDEENNKLLEEKENERLEKIALSQIDNEKTYNEDCDELTTEEMNEILAEVAKEKAKQKGTPIYQRFITVQNAYPTSIVCMRLGDFYEFFGESAKTVASELDLTLTGRDCGLEDRTPMCGIPYHAAENYFGKIRNKHDLVVIESGKDSNTKYLHKFNNEHTPKQEKIDLETGEVLENNTLVENDIISKLKAIFGSDMEVRL